MNLKRKPVGAEELTIAIHRDYALLSHRHDLDEIKQSDADLLYSYLYDTHLKSHQQNLNQSTCRLQISAGEKLLKFSGEGRAFFVAQIVDRALSFFHNMKGDNYAGAIDLANGVNILMECAALLGLSPRLQLQQKEVASYMYKHAMQLDKEAGEFDRRGREWGAHHQWIARRRMDNAKEIEPDVHNIDTPLKPRRPIKGYKIEGVPAGGVKDGQGG